MDGLGDLDNFVTVPLSNFMFVVRDLWLDETSKYNFSGAQDKIEILLNFLHLGREATIIDFAQYDLPSEMQKLTEHKIHVEDGRQNGVKTFREKKAFNHSELTRLYMIHSLVQNFNDNNHIQMAEYEKEIARLKAENEQLQLIVRLHKVKPDESEDDEDWYEDADLAKILPELPRQRSIYVDDGTKQNPYCITIANKRKLNEFQCEVWTLPELLKLDQSELVEEFTKWREAGFAASLPPSVIWDGLEERFKQHYFQYYPDEHKLTEMWNIAWTEYWLIVALFGKPKEIPQKLKDYQSKILNGQGLISSNADAEHLTEKDVLLGTQENFMEFIQKRCAPVED